MKHLSIAEREIIMVMLGQWKSKREIWRKLWRHVQSIIDEIKKNSVRWKYIAHKAHHKAYVRRLFAKKPIKKIRSNDRLERYIRTKIKDYRSPEIIAWRWNKENPQETISVPSVYAYIYSKFSYWLVDYLYSNRWWRKRRKWYHKNSSNHIKHRVFVDARPEKISKLQEFWHREADLIVWPQWTKEVLLVIIEKITRKKMAIKLPNKTAKGVENTLKKQIMKWWIISITFDNWVEFSNHYKLWIPTYFSHPYHAWEKAQVERGNRDYRRFFPKWTQRKKISQKEIDKITDKLNNMPMKVLEFNTPNEIFSKYSNLYNQVSVLTL